MITVLRVVQKLLECFLKEVAPAEKCAPSVLLPFLPDPWNADMMAEAPAAILHHEANLKAVLQENTRSPRP